MRSLLIATACLALASPAGACGGKKKPKKYWQESYTNPGTQRLWDVAVDPDGNIYTVGTTDMPAVLGGSELAGAQGTVILSLASSGSHRWSLGVFDHLDARRLVLDPADGGLIIAGTTNGAVTLGDTNIPAPEGDNVDLVVFKVSAKGEHMWARHYGGGKLSLVPTVAIDAQSNLFVGGGFDGDLDLGGEPLIGREGQTLEAFVAKFAPDGALLWQKKYGTGLARVTDIATDANGRLGLVGAFSSEIDFGSGPIKTPVARSGFMAILNGAGELDWVQEFPGQGITYPTSVGFSAKGHIYAAGDFSGAINFGGPTTPFQPVEEGGDAAFIVKRASDGTHIWNTYFDDHVAGRGQRTRLIVDPDGAAMVTGRFTQSISLSDKLLVSNGDADGVIVKLDGSGRLEWARNYGEEGDDDVLGAAYDPTGFVVVVGSLNGDAFAARIPHVLH